MDVKLFVMVLGMVVCLVFVDCATIGTASFYPPPYSREYMKHPDSFIAAASNFIWANKTTCGRKLSVKCIGPLNPAPNRVPDPCKPKKVLVEIIEHCPHCHETLNLSEEAFQKIANLDAGIVKIEYHE
ncbi:EG45-like domain containing protein [Morella rubra]|uniref:EG45-like domain containing protein n=1 Tax=Morella rubra TaxID=262757 RepID=A0A6A1W796_9ROSI|nr:EG45-like domain containing protein [Morella rubra]